MIFLLVECIFLIFAVFSFFFFWWKVARNDAWSILPLQQFVFIQSKCRISLSGYKVLLCSINRIFCDQEGKLLDIGVTCKQSFVYISPPRRRCIENSIHTTQKKIVKHFFTTNMWAWKQKNRTSISGEAHKTVEQVIWIHIHIKNNKYKQNTEQLKFGEK